MRTIIAALVGSALVANGVGCTKGKPAGPAWTRWGITKPTTDDDAEAKLAEAYRLFYELKLDSAEAAYQDLHNRFPKSAEALLGLTMAYRYSGQRDVARFGAIEAYKLDPDAAGVLLNYADLILPFRTGPLPEMSDSARYAESERCNLRAAASKHPFNAHAHVSLWVSYMVQGRLADARRQAFELSQKHYYPQPLLDFARNLLVDLEPDAILFTNGDNDTYPSWVVQNARESFRPDVTVANLTLLNVPAVVKMMRDSLGLPVSFTDDELMALAPETDANGKGTLLPSQQVVENVLANAAEAKRPVYFAVTVSTTMSAPYVDRLVLEGLVNRVTDGKRTVAVDVDRIAENLKKNYRLDWPKTLPPWPANMSPITRRIAPLAVNYANIYVQLATAYDSLGRKTEAAAAWPEAVTWLLRDERQDEAAAVVEEWLRRSPDDAAAKKLKAELEKTGKTD